MRQERQCDHGRRKTEAEGRSEQQIAIEHNFFVDEVGKVLNLNLEHESLTRRNDAEHKRKLITDQHRTHSPGKAAKNSSIISSLCIAFKLIRSIDSPSGMAGGRIAGTK